jgi:inhibitor of KinA
MNDPQTAMTFPRVARMGLSGLLISFADQLNEPANRAALAFKARMERESWQGVEECATSLVSAFVRFDPVALTYSDLKSRVDAVLAEADWYAAPLPENRKLWRIPTAFEGSGAPQLTEAADMAGRSVPDAVADLTAAPVRALALGYAPGQPYLGTLPAHWNLPRQTALTPTVEIGALVVAVRQLIVFATRAPTGWRQVGMTGFKCFRPDLDDPFSLRPGDECLFVPVSAAKLAELSETDPMGGAVMEPLA